MSALFEQAEQSRESVAIIDSTGSHTYGELLDASASVAARLLGDADDLQQQAVAFLVPPGFEYVAIQWGIWRAGGMAVPLGVMHPAQELAYVLDNARPTKAIAHPGFEDRLTAITNERSIPLLATASTLAAEPVEPLPTIDPTRRAMMLYTSGSTGKPKGVVTTHATVLAQVDSLVEAWRWSADDHILHVLPLHHIHGIINVLSCAMRVGATCEFLPAFDATEVWNRMSAGSLSLFMAVPTIYARLIAAFDAASQQQQTKWSAGAKTLRLMVSGSAALPVPTLERWEKMTGHRLLERYGMTEIGMGLSNPYDGERRPGFVGKPLPDVEARRTNEAGEVVEDNEPGEIEIRGRTVFSEYWERPEATAESFRDGWFRTGDIAVVEDGAFRILGRNSVDIIKTGGYKVSALDIEDVVRTHPLVADCAVVGVPDAEWGERVAVCVVGPDTSKLVLTELRTWGKERLAVYKVPSLLMCRDELPRNAMGKVQKPEIRKLFEATDNSD